MPRFDDCCNQEETVQFDCPCTINIPTAIPSVSLTFDLNLLTEQTASFTGNLDFQCCDGNHILAPSAEEHTLPVGFSITYDIATSSNGDYAFTIHFTDVDAYGYVPSQSTFIIYYVVCGVEIPITVYRTFVDNCVEVLPVMTSPAPVISYDVAVDDGAVYELDIDFTEIVCCGEPTTVIIRSVSEPDPASGVSYTGFSAGYGFSGQGTIPLTFSFSSVGPGPSPAVTGTYSCYVDFEVCGIVFRQNIYFTIFILL